MSQELFSLHITNEYLAIRFKGKKVFFISPEKLSLEIQYHYLYFKKIILPRWRNKF